MKKKLILGEYTAVLKRETYPRAVCGFDFLHGKVLVDISGSYEWHEYKTLNQNVGKEDIDSNPIYADSSIVEFEYLEELHKSVTLVGVFTWNDDELRYEIDIPEKLDPYVCLSYDSVKMSNFKVIGTVERNPELLKK